MKKGALLGGAGIVAGSVGGIIGTAQASAAVNPPVIHDRASWNARPPAGNLTIRNYRPTYIVVHHMATPNTTDYSLEKAYSMARSRQDYHMDGRGYTDVGDHFGNSRGGHITEGRMHSLPLLQEGGTRFVQGGHALGGNEHSIGIENEGTYIDVAPTTAQWNSLVHLCAYICAQYQIPANEAGIVGHRQVTATQCPGDLFFGMLPQLRAEVAAMLGGGGGDPQPPPNWPSVRQGAGGERVRSIQYMLRQHGIDTHVDGDFGSQTDRNVKAFQTAKGLAVDGLVGPQTWPVLVVPTQQGSGGEAVKAVQSQLNNAHGISTAIDGDFGPQTAQSVSTFQTRKSLGANGAANLETWQALVA